MLNTMLQSSLRNVQTTRTMNNVYTEGLERRVITLDVH